MLNLQNGSSKGRADSAGRGSDSGCECLLLVLHMQKMNGSFLPFDPHVNLLLVLQGHKPEGCKGQPNHALSVQGGQTVETAAGMVS